MYAKFNRRQGGFSLTELLVALAIAALLATMGVPAMGSMADSMRMTNASNRLHSHLHLARSEAIKRRGRVALCKSADGVYCTSAGDWEQGWIVFSDTNNDGLREWNEDVIAVEGAQPARLLISANQHINSNVSYAPGGEARLLTGAFQAGTFTVCNDSAGRADARQVTVNSVGRARVQKGLLASCL